MNKMKRYAAIVMIIILIASALSGCQNNDQPVSPSSGNNGEITAGFVNLQGDESHIDEKNLISILSELISDKYAGRLTGTEGNLKAAEYIASYFKELGLENPEGAENYLHYYKQAVHSFTSKPLLNVVDMSGNVVKELENGDNFAIRIMNLSEGSVDVTAPIYVLENSKDLKADNANIKGKIIFVSDNTRGMLNTRDALQIGAEAGALAVIVHMDLTSNSRRNSELVMVPLRESGFRQSIPFIYIDNDGADAIKKASEDFNSLRFKCEFVSDWNKSVPNVIGLLPGSDPKLKDEYIIIGAHFDHVGDNMNGTYNSGALDNASGTSAMMEIARLVTKNKLKPKRTILFMAFNGEETGLVGSREYASNPIYPLDKAVMINLDMVGASAKMPLSIMASEEKHASMVSELLGYAKDLGIDAKSGYGGGSDHASFSDYGVPSVLLIHEDFLNGYHSYMDNIEDVSDLRLEEVVKLVMYYLDKKAF